MKKNRIPREFNRITGKMLVKTNVNNANDTIYIYKEERGLSLFNPKTQENVHCFLSMIRNGEVFEFLTVE